VLAAGGSDPQLLRSYNIYFTAAAIISLIMSAKNIAPISPVTAVLPLVVVLVVTMIKDGIEDYVRGWAAPGRARPWTNGAAEPVAEAAVPGIGRESRNATAPTALPTTSRSRWCPWPAPTPC